ncbi:MAG TPA: PIG-L family deacetylase, partial [Nitrospiria bacterium]|nr:PIG-L family deacetylase [Nitrospiria bacterium]
MRLKWSHVYRYYELLEPFLKVSTPLEELPKGENILVIAPHIDDETIGCGGTLAKHAHSGKKVTVLFA